MGEVGDVGGGGEGKEAVTFSVRSVWVDLLLFNKAAIRPVKMVRCGVGRIGEEEGGGGGIRWKDLVLFRGPRRRMSGCGWVGWVGVGGL